MDIRNFTSIDFARADLRKNLSNMQMVKNGHKG
jgi:hypothetical protein